MLDALRQGHTMAIFPEGTTTDGHYLHAFHASLLQPAVDHGALVVPVAIRYTLPDGSIDTAPAYCHDLTLGQSLKNVLARRRIHAEVTYLSPIEAQGKTRRELARLTEAAISTALNLPNPHKKPGTPGDPPA
jgi:1-acyl-sn-glycerol-3-phosphate acyltransferase